MQNSGPGSTPSTKALKLKPRLAQAPQTPPRYGVKVRGSSGEEVVLGDPRATRALVALMNQHAVIGGAACHWGGPSALAEIMAAIHGLMFQVKDRPWYEAFHFVNDVGHAENGVYALRANLGFDDLNFESLKKFRSIESKLTGHGESHLNPEGVLLSNGPLGSSVSQAQGLSFGDRKLGNDRLTFLVVSDGASMEGEAKEAFGAIPGLAAKGLMNPFVMVISDNNTKLSGRIDKDAFSMAPSFKAMEDLGWELIKVENGHDLQTVYSELERAQSLARKNPKKPVCLWAKTIKGYGVKSTEESSSGGHGFPLGKHDPKLVDFIQEIFKGEAPEEFVKWAQELGQKPAPSKSAQTSTVSEKSVKSEKIQAGIARGAIRAKKEGLPVYSVSADLAGSTGTAAFQKEFPNDSIDVGVAEANMVSMAAGLSKVGFIPIMDTFAQFGITKGNLPLIMAALSQAPVIGVFSHTGFQDAADGASHQATTYLSATSSIPHTVVVSCSCSREAEHYMYEAIKRTAREREAGGDGENIVFFLGRENFPEYYVEDLLYEWGKAQVLRRGSDVTIVTTGSLVPEALKASKELEGQGISATVINNVFVNRVDVETFSKEIKNTQGRVVTLEDHQVMGGMGSLLTHALVQAGLPLKVKSLGIHGEFGQSAYEAQHLYDKHGLSASHVVKAAKELVRG